MDEAVNEIMDETVRLSDFFKRYRSGVITIIGSGGKTSLLWFLARCFADGNGGAEAGASGCRVLVTTTTKMGAPDFTSGLFDYFINFSGINYTDCTGRLPPAADTEPLPAIKPGITLAGCHAEGSTKTTALPFEMLSCLTRNADITLIEGDGSRMLPLKGWADYEPVVVPQTTVTVGIMPLWALGMPVSEAIVHRLDLFCALTGAQKGDVLTTAYMAAAISGEGGRRGLFAEARGKRILFFNQAENETALRAAREVAGLLPSAFQTSLHAVIAGSIKENRITVFQG
jgi:probable selenium-dependent hydroxylase accessory protein YqeC